MSATALPSLGPAGPFPGIALGHVLERRWLHYAFLSRDGEMAMVANVAWLGASKDDPAAAPLRTSILLLHRDGAGWEASQFHARVDDEPWSSFRCGPSGGAPGTMEMGAVSGRVRVSQELRRTSRPCTSQCAPFAGGQHLRWQSETGIAARGTWTHGGVAREVEAVGYHERVRGLWGWPELGGWVFGFANHAPETDAAPEAAVVFTLIQPRGPREAAGGSVMVWRKGRLVRQFPRRCVRVAVRGELDRDRVVRVPALAGLLGVAPMPPVPRRLVVTAASGADRIAVDFLCDQAARVVIPAETSLRPFSVHEVVGTCRAEGRVGGRALGFEARAVVEFAGGAGGD